MIPTLRIPDSFGPTLLALLPEPMSSDRISRQPTLAFLSDHSRRSRSRLGPAALLVVGLLLGLSAGPTAAQTSTVGSDLDLGTVEFATSGEASAHRAFTTGLLALHSFWYPEARTHFRRAQELQPELAIAYWGEAMTYDHPLWGPLGQHDREAGLSVLGRLDSVASARSIAASDRERAYLEAVRTLYDGQGDLAARRRAYLEKMATLAERYPNDEEATIFAALARMSRPDFSLENADHVVAVAAPLEELFTERKNHPGVLHYLIHAYDSDTFARMGLRPARLYADLAPSASHALHMPSHIFRQLQMWEKMAASNVDAYEASVQWQKETGRPLKDRDYHSFHWLMDAYLAMEDFEGACSLIAEIDSLDKLARERGEDLGRIPSVAEEVRSQYRDRTEAVNRSVSCDPLE